MYNTMRMLITRLHTHTVCRQNLSESIQGTMLCKCNIRSYRPIVYTIETSSDAPVDAWRGKCVDYSAFNCDWLRNITNSVLQKQ